MSYDNLSAWEKSSCLEGRANVLLVEKGLKRGAIIHKHPLMIDAIEKAGLAYKPSGETALTVCRPAEVKDWESLKTIKDAREHHIEVGRLLGYPECCAQEYVGGMTPEQKGAAKWGFDTLSYRFGQEMASKIEEDGTYPDILNYNVAGFTPCSIDCPEANRLFKSWKNELEKSDPEALESIVSFNKFSNRKYGRANSFLSNEGEVI
jgi:hypothetical protein